MKVWNYFDSALLHAMLLAIAFRATFFVFVCFFPMLNEAGLPISPLLMQYGGDMDFYMLSRELYGDNTGHILDVLSNMFVKPIGTWKQLMIVSGPLQPTLLALFQYEPGNTLPLASFFFIMSSAITCLWLRWLSGQGVPAIWLLVFALLPNPVWFMIYISTDLTFAVLVGCFYIVYFSKNITGYNRQGILICLLFAAAINRPNALSLLLFVLADKVFGNSSISTRVRWQIGIVGAFLLGPVIFFYLPYLLSFVESSQQYTYFGITQRDYLVGAFDNLPTIIDIPISWLALLVGKSCYFVGIRPSYGDTALWLVLIRSAGGLILLPGLVFSLINGNNSQRLFLLLYLLPIFLGATQDRYNLPIMPILFCHGALAITYLWQRILEPRRLS